MSNTLGSKLRVTVFGQSHAPAIGATDDQRTAPVLGMVALLNGGIESVHVDMYDLALGHG